MKLVIIGFLSLNTIFFVSNSMASNSKEINTCLDCHKASNGNPMFPNLVGQKEKYLENELKAYRGHDRDTKIAKDYMWGITRNLSDDKIKEIAQYFSNLSPVETKHKESEQIKLGKDIYENGIPDKNVRSCSECHGLDGEGMGSIPKLSGQYANYLQKQLQDFKSNTRHEGLHKMPSLVKDLSTAEIKAIAAYLSNH